MASTFIITSPTAQFTTMIRSVSSELNIHCIVIEAVLKRAVEQTIASCLENDVTAVISSGGTADMIREAIDIPVLEAETNDFDILSALLDARTVSSKIAYVLYARDFIDELPHVTEILQIDVKQYLFTTDTEMLLAITNARQDGYEVIVCGCDSARKKCDALGIGSVLVKTSRRTIVDLFRRAKLIQEIRDKEQENKKQLLTAFDFFPDSILYLNEQDRISCINRAGLELFELHHEQEIVDKILVECCSSDELQNLLQSRRLESGRALEVCGKTVLLRSTPVFSEKRFLGTVLSFQRASEVEKLEHAVRRQAQTARMTAGAWFEDLERLSYARPMRKCLNRALRYAKTNSTVLIIGESGTGKELLAQSIHNASPRQNNSFVVLNCAALPQALLESELFGYDEGVFSGTKQSGKPGYFELAHGGTLFLDELGLMPLNVQLQLLRVLQEKQVLRVGGSKMIPVDVRVVAATNAKLEEKVKDGSFRKELYYRISVLRVAIPPLRQRIQDIPPLVEHYLRLFCKEHSKNIEGCSTELMDALQRHTWPGNVRELVNYMMRLVICSPGPQLSADDLKRSDIRLNQLPLSAIEQQDAFTARPGSEKNSGKKMRGETSIQLRPNTLEQMEKDIIRWHMRRYNGNRLKICEELQISRTTLWKKLKNMNKGTTDR